MVDRDIGWGDQHGLSVTECIEPVFSVVVAHPSGSCATEGHRLNKQMNVHKVHPATAVGEFADETVDSLLIAAEDKPGERPRGRCHAFHRLVEGLECQDWEDGTEYLILHDFVLPGDGIQERGIEVVRLRIGFTTGNYLGGVNECGQPLH